MQATSTPARRSPKRRGAYHHGDLRAALVRTVVEIVEERGLGAVTMAECAKRAGVSVAAPYRHFASLEALLEAAAESCYIEWIERRAGHRFDASVAREALNTMHADFFLFAQERPGPFLLVFDSSLRGRSALVDRWTRDELDRLVEIVAALSGAAPKLCRATAMGITALVMGHAMMSLRGFSAVPLARAAVLARESMWDMVDGFAARSAEVGAPTR